MGSMGTVGDCYDNSVAEAFFSGSNENCSTNTPGRPATNSPSPSSTGSKPGTTPADDTATTTALAPSTTRPPKRHEPHTQPVRHTGVLPKHRLNPRGNRKLNHAIHIAAISQLRYNTEGRSYYDRKIAEGKSSKDAIRALKRRISDRVYRHLTADARRCLTN